MAGRLLMIVLINLCLNHFAVQGREISKAKDIEVNSVEPTIVADEFDCIDFYKQPTFSHQSLKGHQVQLKPSFSASLMVNEELSSIRSSEYQGCPIGKVPIQKRIGKENDSFHRLTQTYPGQHFAVVRNVQTLKVHGVGGQIDIQNLQLQKFQVSAAQVWIQNGTQSQLNSIQTGWEVNPVLYGDSYTRMTAFWTADNFGKTGCYNTRCPGFVQVNQRYFLGQKLPGSEPGGTQYVVNIMIKQDETSGNWWLVAEGDIMIGYWPKELFTSMRDGATFIQYGGWTVNIPNSISPPMGNGQFASKHIEDEETAFIARMKLVNGGYAEASPDFLTMETYSDDTACYTAYYNGFVISKLQHAMSFGGPGGSCTN